MPDGRFSLAWFEVLAFLTLSKKDGNRPQIGSSDEKTTASLHRI
jgi:hypothetical protein